MNISRILVACYKHDYWQAKTCVASIRFWYPDIPISLIKDELVGEFNTNELEESFNVEIFPLKYQKFGWGISKLEPLFISNSNERFLIIDADIIFIGPVIDELNKSDADFIVSPEEHKSPNSDWFKRTYYDYNKVKKFDPTFEFPAYTFNTGQFIATPGKVNRTAFEKLIDYTNSDQPVLLKTDTFACADQGLLNYLLPAKQITGELKIDKVGFMIWSGDKKKLDSLSLEIIKNKQGYPFVIHYAGRGKRPIEKFDRKDIYCFFLNLYFKKQSFGTLKLFWLKLKLRAKFRNVK